MIALDGESDRIAGLVCATCAREFAFEASMLAGLRARLERVTLPEDQRRKPAAVLRQARARPSGA